MAAAAKFRNPPSIDLRLRHNELLPYGSWSSSMNDQNGGAFRTGGTGAV